MAKLYEDIQDFKQGQEVSSNVLLKLEEERVTAYKDYQGTGDKLASLSKVSCSVSLMDDISSYRSAYETHIGTAVRFGDLLIGYAEEIIRELKNNG